jgi:uncharacterized RDD family membrane protein YckC
MPTGFDYIGQDSALQQHWLKRFIAIIVDAVIVYVPTVVFISVIGGHYFSAGLLSGVFLFLYSALFDFAVGGTVGKLVLQMKAVSMKGRLSFPQAMMRNAAKVFAPLLLIDLVIGLAVETKDPRQKWTDQLAHTSVIVHGQPGGV